jgi:CHAT domain-containing protein
VLVQDGALEGVPFAALHDGRAAVVERHAVWLAASLAGAVAARPAPAADRRSGTFVAPDFDAAANPGLPPLAGARAEVAAVARMYEPTELSGPTATTAALSGALRRGPMVHFAGHAVFDPVRPARSYLLVAPERPGDPGRLFAFQIDGLDLTRTRLVILSACSSLGADDGGPPGFTGLAGALLGAGAGGVVGSLWPVGDTEAQEVMVRFHERYRRGGDAPAALRGAQLALLHASEPRLRSPAVWASFTFVTR